MNVTQELYHRCLATVAPREVEAARASGTYAATWDSKKPNKTDLQLRARILDALADRPYTTTQLRAKANVSRERMYTVLARLEDENLLKSKRVVVNARPQSQWRLV